MIKLPAPLNGVSPKLYDAIKLRRTKRQITNELLTTQELSDLLFVANGQTKKKTTKQKSKKVVASSCNSQKVNLYCALESGVYKYEPDTHTLHKLVDDYHTPNIVKQSFFKEAPVLLIYTACFNNKTGVIKVSHELENLLIGTEVGAMSHNVALYCTSNNLGTALVALNNEQYVVNTLNLINEKLLYTQPIGRKKA